MNVGADRFPSGMGSRGRIHMISARVLALSIAWIAKSSSVVSAQDLSKY